MFSFKVQECDLYLAEPSGKRLIIYPESLSEDNTALNNGTKRKIKEKGTLCQSPHLI